jgi:hypothetical protein
MVITHRAVAAIMVFTAAFLALSGAGSPIGPAGALLATIALAATALFLFAATARRWRAEAMEDARGLALTDAQDLMRRDIGKG